MGAEIHLSGCACKKDKERADLGRYWPNILQGRKTDPKKGVPKEPGIPGFFGSLGIWPVEAQRGPRKYPRHIGNPYQMPDNKTQGGGREAPAPLGRRRRRRFVVFNFWLDFCC